MPSDVFFDPGGVWFNSGDVCFGPRIVRANAGGARVKSRGAGFDASAVWFDSNFVCVHSHRARFDAGGARLKTRGARAETLMVLKGCYNCHGNAVIICPEFAVHRGLNFDRGENTMQKVKVGFQKDAIPQKMQKTAVVVGQITGNPAFPKAQPMLPDVTASVNALNEASQAAQSSQAATKQLFEVQNQKLADLDAQLAALCNDVNVEANGDETALMSSGFELAKTTATAAATPGAVTDFSLTRGDNPGVVDGQCHAVKNARAYESRFMVTPITS